MRLKETCNSNVSFVCWTVHTNLPTRRSVAPCVLPLLPLSLVNHRVSEAESVCAIPYALQIADEFRSSRRLVGEVGECLRHIVLVDLFLQLTSFMFDGYEASSVFVILLLLDDSDDETETRRRKSTTSNASKLSQTKTDGRVFIIVVCIVVARWRTRRRGRRGGKRG